MKYKTLLLTTLLLCGGCATQYSNTEQKIDRLTIPAVKVYTAEEQKKAADEMRTFCDRVPMLCRFVNDYGRMRDQARAALGLKVDVNR